MRPTLNTTDVSTSDSPRRGTLCEMGPDQLDTERLVLEPLSLDHSDGMFLLWSNPEVCRYAGSLHDDEGRVIPSPVRTSSDSDRIIDFWTRARSDGWGFRWALCERSSGIFMGTTGFNSLGARAEYAYHLDPVFWGRGFMTEATSAAMAWAHANGATHVEAFIDPANDRSIRLVERHGFERTDESQDGALRFVKHFE